MEGYLLDADTLQPAPIVMCDHRPVVLQWDGQGRLSLHSQLRTKTFALVNSSAQWVSNASGKGVNTWKVKKSRGKAGSFRISSASSPAFEMPRDLLFVSTAASSALSSAMSKVRQLEVQLDAASQAHGAARTQLRGTRSGQSEELGRLQREFDGLLHDWEAERERFIKVERHCKVLEQQCQELQQDLEASDRHNKELKKAKQQQDRQIALLHAELDRAKLAACGAGQQLTSAFPLAAELRQGWLQWKDAALDSLLDVVDERGSQGVALVWKELTCAVDEISNHLNLHLDLLESQGASRKQARDVLRSNFPAALELEGIARELQRAISLPGLELLVRLLAAFALSDPVVTLRMDTVNRSQPYNRHLGAFLDNPRSYDAQHFQARVILPAVECRGKELVPCFFAAIDVRKRGSQAVAPKQESAWESPAALEPHPPATPGSGQRGTPRRASSQQSSASPSPASRSGTSANRSHSGSRARPASVHRRISTGETVSRYRQCEHK
eukprot:m.270969 g.270969  ORF g.270969 m.270969 type:complete len:499 (-) comp22833_c1_seq3:30-1526(-)